MAKVHILKCWPPFYGEIAGGRKRVEVRHDDRGYKAGDCLVLQEWDADRECRTGRQCSVRITHVMALSEVPMMPEAEAVGEFVALSIEPWKAPDPPAARDAWYLGGKLLDAPDCSFVVGESETGEVETVTTHAVGEMLVSAAVQIANAEKAALSRDASDD